MLRMQKGQKGPDLRGSCHGSRLYEPSKLGVGVQDLERI